MDQASRADIAGLHFLIAEDDAFQRHWLSVMLARLGAQHISEAEDGRAALRLLQQPGKRVDIVIVDLNMPVMDGIELVRHLAQLEDPVAVILTSGLGAALLFSVESLSQTYGVDLLGTFEKPATPEVLQELISRFRPPEARSRESVGVPVFTLENIREGLARGEFAPYFQPKVEMKTGKATAMEAFARWQHPQYGLIKPAAFIPLLERSGEMEQLTWQVIDACVRSCSEWSDAGLDLSVSINLSPAALMQGGLAERILAHVQQHELAPGRVTFEISELMAMTDSPVCLENLARLRMKGFGLSVDDYGTAHSNVQQLLRIPFLDLKIDRSFVAGAAANEQMHIALASCLELARKLHRNSVAVGVETREDWDLLRALGCTYAQGHYIAKPMEASMVQTWVEEWAQFF